MNPDILARILRMGTHKELTYQLNETPPSNETQQWFRSVDPGTLLLSEDPEWKHKMLQCMAYSNLSLSKETVLRYIPDLKLETWDIYALYKTYKDTDILERALNCLSGPEKVRDSANTLLHESIKDGQDSISKWIAAKYKECVPHLTEMYKNAINYKNVIRIQSILNLGYVPPKHSTQRGSLHIHKFLYDDPGLEYYKRLEQEQMDYFINIYPLRTSVISSDLARDVKAAISQCTQTVESKGFFLVCVDGVRLCGSMYVERDKEIYKIFLFSTRTLMDPIYRGTGREMFEYLVTDSKQNGIREIQVVSATQALDFYHSLGFLPQSIGSVLSKKMLYYAIV